MRKGINIRAGFDLEGFSKSSQNLSRSLKKTARKMDAIGKSFSTYVTAPIIAIGGLSVKAAADIETLKTSLQTALGGTASAADGAFKSIEAFASKTPYALAEVTSGFIKLKNMGLDPSMDALRSYGNTASAMGKSLNDMVEAVADAAVGEFERLKEFGIKAKSQGDQVSFTFKGVTTTIGKNSAEIEEYLQGIGNTEFAGGIEKQSATLNGILSTMKDNMSLAAASIGEVILPEIKQLASYISGLATKFRELSPATKKMIVIVAGLVAAIGPLILGIAAVTTALAFLAANPIVLIITGIILAIAGLAAAFVYVKNNIQAFADFFYNVWVDISTFFIDVIKSMMYPYLKLADLLGLDIGSGVTEFLDGFKLKARESTEAFQSIEEAVAGVKSKFAGLVASEDPIEGVTTKLGKLDTAIKKVKKSASQMWADLGAILDKMDKPAAFDPSVRLKIEGIEVDSSGITSGIEDLANDISAQLNEMLNGLIVDSAVLLGQFFGNFATGEEGAAENFGRGILQSIGAFMGQFGEAMIALGVAQAMLNTAISLGPLGAALAIAGGIALVAAGSALSNLSKKGIDGSSSSGGGYSSPSPSYGGMGQSGIDMITSEVVISGREMLIVQSREKDFRR